MYTTVNELLQSAGYETTVIYLPSVGDKEKASGVTLSDDGAAISAVVASYADQGKDIVLATHSYGGIAGAEGAKGLSKKEREENGKKGGIIRLVYITALIAQVGQSLGEVMAEIPPSQVIVDVSDIDIFNLHTFCPRPNSLDFHLMLNQIYRATILPLIRARLVTIRSAISLQRKVSSGLQRCQDTPPLLFQTRLHIRRTSSFP